MATPNLPTELSYNGYTFGPYTHISVSLQMQEDDAQRTVLYQRYLLRAQTTIVAEAGDTTVGEHFRRMRQRLSKAGQALTLNHAGFGTPMYINQGGTVGVWDVAFGPKPRIINWDPVGETNSVEVTWECELCLPICDGSGGVRYTGLSALNYGISYRIDKYGYTTRTISGYLEIAMTRRGNTIPDTADAYRSAIAAKAPDDYERETTWQLSPDKRRADFSITDSQIQSPNAYAPGVVKIRANHRVGWNRRNAAILQNAISATIELSHNEPRGKAWDIFRAIVQQRTNFSMENNYGGGVMLETLDIDEELYGHAISFMLTYRVIAKQAASSKFFTATGLFSKLTNWNDWASWRASMNLVQTSRGISGLAAHASDDKIVDLCTDVLTPPAPPVSYVPAPPPTNYYRLCNEKPPPDRSYVAFDATLTSIEEAPATEQITIGRDEMKKLDFNPNDPTSNNGETEEGAEISRYIESAPAGLKFQWIGYCERLGYDIPKPGRLTFGDATLVRTGKALFRKKFMGLHFCQPLYAAAWNMTYVVDRRPKSTPADEADPYKTPYTAE